MTRRTKRIDLPQVRSDRGNLMFAEDSRHVPFPIKRIFSLYDIPAGGTRGAHAHRTQHQFIVMMAGRCSISVDEGSETLVEILDAPTQGLYVPPEVWIVLSDFSHGAVCLVLTSAHFDEADYIRDYGEFSRIARTS
jgi:dTDP-4-dehydrorhamnose 3,5-epimerase-like enzyme